MLLGEQIARLEDETVAAEMLLGLGDLTLTARLTEAASRDGLTPGAFIAESVGRFVQGASDEEWLTLIGLMSRADNPGQVFLCRVLHAVLPKLEAAA
jgi:hypothetical protein